MSSTAWPAPRRLSSTNVIKEEDGGLTESLSQLSLTNGPEPRSPPRISEPKKNSRSQSRHSSTSPHRRRLPSRSPSHGRHSRASTPPLLHKASINSLHSANGMGGGAGRTSSRRSSIAQAMSPTAKSHTASGGFDDYKPPPTASSVASNYFQAELAAHHGIDATLDTETVVILHDAVYGHRYSRPRTSRSALSTIVERPERIKASVLGVSMAYVRLGERHCEGINPIHPNNDPYALRKIPFRIKKTTRKMPLTSQAVTNVHGTKWMDELKYMCDAAESILATGGRELQRPEMEREEPAAKFHEGDLYLCAESLDAMEGALGAVCDAVDVVLSSSQSAPKRAFVGVRPPGHHCSASYPSGFCWVNNVHVGIMHGILTHGLTHAAIIDFDLHHGDGSQAITWEHNSRSLLSGKNMAPWKKTSIGYFSLHDINSYPCEMGDEEKVKNASLCIDNAHGQNIWNVHLQSWKTEQDFWELYETKYSVILEKTRNYLQTQAKLLRESGQEPKAIIFFSAGFDASEWESAGMQRHQVNVPTEFYARLTQDIVKIASEQGLGTDGRVISVLEGGYSDRALFSGTFSHLSGLVGNQSPHQNNPTMVNGGGLGFEMGQKLGTIADDVKPIQKRDYYDGVSLHQYDPSWWASQQLDKLEEAMANPLSPPRKPRTSEPPAYFTPTAASSAKVVDPAKMRRSLSGLSSSRPKPPRPASPIAPDVPWTIAAHELSKLLIPSDRQTDSCRAEDLNAEATRVRRDKQANLAGIPSFTTTLVERPGSKMALRERRQRPIGSIDEEMEQSGKGGSSGSGGQRSAVSTPRRASAKNVRPPKAVTTENTPRQSTADPSNTPRPSTADPSTKSSSRRSSRRLSATPGLFSPDKDVPVPPLPAGFEQLVSRPPTSGSSRPESAMSTQVANPTDLSVKKTRSRSASRKEAVPKTPRTSRRTTTPASKAKTAVKQRAAPPTPSVPASEPPNPSVDKITSGMKKIRINLITQAQKDACAARGRQRPEPLAEVVAKPEIHVKTCLDQDRSSTEPSYSSTIDASPLQLAAASNTSFLSRTTDMSSPSPAYSPLDVSSPLGMKGAHGPKPPATTDFIAYQPEGPNAVSVDRQEPLKWLPPNIPTPSANTPVSTPMPKKSNLFHYTEGIPFAPRLGGGKRPEQQTGGSGQAQTAVKTEPDLETTESHGN